MKSLMLSALMLGACAPNDGPAENVLMNTAGPPPFPAPSPAPSGRCVTPDHLQNRYSGQAYTASIGTELQRAAEATRLRVIRPGDAVTMDFREDRLNIELDGGGRVRALRCG